MRVSFAPRFNNDGELVLGDLIDLSNEFARFLLRAGRESLIEDMKPFPEVRLHNDLRRGREREYGARFFRSFTEERNEVVVGFSAFSFVFLVNLGGGGVGVDAIVGDRFRVSQRPFKVARHTIAHELTRNEDRARNKDAQVRELQNGVVPVEDATPKSFPRRKRFDNVGLVRRSDAQSATARNLRDHAERVFRIEDRRRKNSIDG